MEKMNVHKKTKGGPEGCIDHIQILKIKLTDGCTKNTEQGTMQGLVTVVIRQCLSFISSSFSLLSILSTFEPWNLLKHPYDAYFQAKGHFMDVAGELKLSVEAMSSPR